MNGFEEKQVVNGTWGEAWFDGEYMAEVTACSGKIGLKYSDIGRTRRLNKGKKLTELEYKGEIKMHKVSSTVIKKATDLLKQGRTPSFTIISNVADPDAIGAERIAFYGCKFEEIALADWETGKNLEETFSFSFDDYELLDLMN